MRVLRHQTITDSAASLLAGVVGVWLLAGCGKAPVDPAVLARVGNSVITTNDFQQEIAYRRQWSQPLPAKEALLEEMILQRALAQQAVAAGLEQDAEVRRAHQNSLIGKLRETQLQPRIKAIVVAPEEVRQAYERELARYSRPAQMRLALLYLKTDRLASDERVTELSAQLARAREKAIQLPAETRGFGALAIENSEDQTSRYKGGDIGWWNQGEPTRWPSAVLAAGFALPHNGDISPVVRASDGLYLVRRTDARNAQVTAFEEVRESIRRRLLAEKQRQVEQSFTAESRKGQTVTINPASLAVLPATAVQMARQPAGQPPVFP